MAMTFPDVRKMALSLDEVEEATSYGTPAFKMRGAMIARLRPELDALVVRLPIEERQELIDADPETYFIIDHYLNYPYVLVRLGHVHPDAMLDLLKAASRSALAEKRKAPSRRRGGKLNRK